MAKEAGLTSAEVAERMGIKAPTIAYREERFTDEHPDADSLCQSLRR